MTIANNPLQPSWRRFAGAPRLSASFPRARPPARTLRLHQFAQLEPTAVPV